MPEITKEKAVRELFKINGKILRPCIVLFTYRDYLLINLESGRQSTRKIWNVGHTQAYVGMQKSAKIYGSMLGLEPEYETKELSTGKIIKVESRVTATPFQQLSWKLSCGLDVAGNSMNLSIRPQDVEKLIRTSISRGLTQVTPSSYLFFMCRTNDLRHEMTPNSKDKWLIFPKNEVLKSKVIPINEALKRSGSNWRLKQSITIEDVVKALKNK